MKKLVMETHFIKRMLHSIQENDILIYFDTGCIINPNKKSKERFNQYIKMLLTAETGTLGFELSFKEYQYTKKEVFDHFRSTSEIIMSNQLMAKVILFKNVHMHLYWWTNGMIQPQKKFFYLLMKNLFLSWKALLITGMTRVFLV